MKKNIQLNKNNKKHHKSMCYLRKSRCLVFSSAHVSVKDKPWILAKICRVGQQVVTIKLGREAYICNFSTWRMRQEDQEFESSVGPTVSISETKQKQQSLVTEVTEIN